MKILYVITSLTTGGAEKLMVDILPRLKKRGFNVELCLFNGKRTPFYESIENAGIKIHSLGETPSYYNIKKLFKLIRLMRNYDIVHTHNAAPQIFSAIGSVLCSVKLVTTEHNTSNRRRGWKLYTPIDRWTYSRYDRIICISDQAEINLRQHLKSDSDKICTIYNGVDVEKYMLAAPSKEILESFKGQHTAIMVAGFRLAKDQKTLIKAYKYLPNDYHLLLVGDGEHRESCVNYTIELGLSERVHFLGLRTDVPSLLKSSDVVVMSSHYEGLSLSNVEGMASGNPFIGSDVDGIREVTKDYGLLFPHGDSKTLAELIRKLSENGIYRTEISAKCVERAKQFDIEQMVGRYIREYDKLTNIHE